MSPAEVDIILKEIGELKTAVAVVVSNQTAHQLQHDEYQLNRPLTCPTAPAVRDCQHSIDSIAAIQRSMREDLSTLKDWKATVDDAELVDAARDEWWQKGLKRTVDNLDKIVLACILAYLLLELGLK